MISNFFIYYSMLIQVFAEWIILTISKLLSSCRLISFSKLLNEDFCNCINCTKYCTDNVFFFSQLILNTFQVFPILAHYKFSLQPDGQHYMIKNSHFFLYPKTIHFLVNQAAQFSRQSVLHKLILVWNSLANRAAWFI